MRRSRRCGRLTGRVRTSGVAWRATNDEQENDENGSVVGRRTTVKPDLSHVCESHVTEVAENEPSEKYMLNLMQDVVHKLSTDITMVTEESFGDEDLSSDPLLMSPYARDIIKYYKQREFMMCPESLFEPNIVPLHREVLVDWLVEVQVHLMLEEKTLHLAVAMIDAFLRIRQVSLKNIQLLGTTCILLACKYEEIYVPDLVSLIKLCDNAYTKREFLSMERCVLRILDYNLFFPSSLGFLSHFQLMAHLKDEQILLICSYLLDLALPYAELQCSLPSLLAAAALYVALIIDRRVHRHRHCPRDYHHDDPHLHRRCPCSDDDGARDIWTPELEAITTYCEMELLVTARLMAEKAQNIPSAKNQAPYKKYNSSCYRYISALPALTDSTLVERLALAM